MELATRWEALAATAGATLAVTGAGVFAAGAPASRAHAAGTLSCGNHSVTVEIESPGAAPQKLKLQAKNVKATGLSCKAAFKFVDAVYRSKAGTPEHYKCKIGKAKEPRGYFPQVCTRGSKKVEYGAQGG
ncbi:MAG TPA: hypothetical protein VN618_10900 [Solirubrobacteraceae bacterium]|nr:hypothetical protein [Solirubrobacteraceae bacterium]